MLNNLCQPLFLWHCTNNTDNFCCICKQLSFSAEADCTFLILLLEWHYILLLISRLPAVSHMLVGKKSFRFAWRVLCCSCQSKCKVWGYQHCVGLGTLLGSWYSSLSNGRDKMCILPSYFTCLTLPSLSAHLFSWHRYSNFLILNINFQHKLVGSYCDQKAMRTLVLVDVHNQMCDFSFALCFSWCCQPWTSG